MNTKISWKKIDLLLDKEYIFDFLDKNLNKIDKEAINLQKLYLYPIKNHRGLNRHVVVFYSIAYSSKKSKNEKTKIVATAHSSGSRKITYKIMKAIYDHGFNTKKYAIPKPLFYNPVYKALFYKAAEGNNLYSFFRKQNWLIVRKNSLKVAVWLARFHDLEIKKIPLKYNHLTLKSIDPSNLLRKKNQAAKHFRKELKNLFTEIKTTEKKVIPKNETTLLHGDLHPENVIINPDKQNITIIDFTETRKGDCAYDIASFIQQVEAMSQGYFRKKQVKKLQEDFIKIYFEKRRIKYTKQISNRINLYMAWVALRGAIYFINSEKEHKIEEFIRECKFYLKQIKL